MSILSIPDVTSDPAHQELTEIFRAHYRLTYRTAYAVTGRAEDAEDSTALNRPVLDRTGIAGDFESQALFDPTTEYFNIMGYVPPVPSGQPSLFTAVEQEFGLKLEAAKAPIEVWTIEQVEKPSEN
jgi:uncharacterized protein (TIGR03435 family)